MVPTTMMMMVKLCLHNGILSTGLAFSPQYYDDNGYDGAVVDIDGHHDNGRFAVVIIDLSVVLPASLVLPRGQ